MGYQVKVFDPMPGADTAAKTLIESAWPALRQLAGAPAEIPWGALSFVDTATKACADADFVQESGPEKPDLKQKLLAEVDAALSPDCIISSSTSGLTLDILRTGLAHPERIMVGHPFNPPHLIPLVEVVGDTKTSEAAVEVAMAFYDHLGKGAGAADALGHRPSRQPPAGGDLARGAVSRR